MENIKTASGRTTATFDDYERIEPPVHVQRPLEASQHDVSPFEEECLVNPSRGAGQWVMRSDFGHVQHSVFPPEAEFWNGGRLLHFYAAPYTTLAHAEGLPSPRDTGKFAPQSSATRQRVRERLFERAQTLPTAGASDLPGVIVRSLPLSEEEVLAQPKSNNKQDPQVLMRAVHTFPNGGGLRPAGRSWPVPMLPPLPRARLAAHTPSWAGEWLPAPAPERVPGRDLQARSCHLDCAAGGLLPPPRASARPRELGASHLCLENYGDVRLPALALAERFPALVHLSVRKAPKLETLADVAVQLPQLRAIALFDCPALHTVGEQTAPFEPQKGGPGHPARVQLASVLLCPAFAAAHDDLCADFLTR